MKILRRLVLPRGMVEPPSVESNQDSAMGPSCALSFSSPLTGEDQDGGAKLFTGSCGSPLPLSSPVEGEDIKSRTSFNRIRSHRSNHSVIFFFVLVLLFVSTDATAQLKKIRVCTPGAGTGSMHIYTAKERGYFAQENLDVDVLVTRGQICTMALINGQMELTTNPNVFDAMVAGKFQGKVIYVTAKTLGHRFIAAPDIKSFNDLKGKTIAISTFGGLTDMLTREILEQHGIRPHKDVALLQLGTPDLRYGALKAGTVKAALVSSTQALTGLRDGFRELPYHQPPWLSSPIVASDELLARERAMLRGFLRAVIKGHLYYGNYPSQGIALTQKVQRIDSQAMAKQIYDDDMLRHNPGGGLEEAAMRKVVERSREMLKVPRKVELAEIFDLNMAKEAEAELKKAKWEP
jgi:ABC-type nitrate/sulfonate/bicarbonate transport system substrate-binding protein